MVDWFSKNAYAMKALMHKAMRMHVASAQSVQNRVQGSAWPYHKQEKYNKILWN